MKVIQRSKFQLPSSIDLNNPELKKTLKNLHINENELKNLDINHDGFINGKELNKLFSFIDRFDNDGKKYSFKDTGKAGKLYHALISSSDKKKIIIQKKNNVSHSTNGQISESRDKIHITLSDGQKINLNKGEYVHGKMYGSTALVDKNNNALLIGKISPIIDKKMRMFLKNIDKTIKKQTMRYQKTGTLADKTELKELKRIRQFGMRFFYNIEAYNKDKAKPVLAKLQGSSDKKMMDFYGVIANPEKVEQMRIIYNRSNSTVIKEVQTSKEMYQKLGNVK